MNLNVQWLSIPRKNGEVRGNIFSSTFVGCIILHICNDHFYSSFLVWLILEETYRAKSVRQCYSKMNGSSLWILSCFKFIIMHLYFKKYIHYLSKCYSAFKSHLRYHLCVTFMLPKGSSLVSLPCSQSITKKSLLYNMARIAEKILKTNKPWIPMTPADIKSCYKVIVIKTVRYSSKVKWIDKWNNYGV